MLGGAAGARGPLHRDSPWPWAWRGVERRPRGDARSRCLGRLRLWHCKTMENGLRIMRDGRMRVLPGTMNYPQGIYSARWPAQTYDIGCQVGLRVAGVVASRAVGDPGKPRRG